MKARLGILTLALAQTACMTMQPVKSPVTFLERNNPEVLRLYSQGRELVVLRSPRLVGGAEVAGFDLTERVDAKYSLSQFQRVEAVQFDRQRTTLLAIGVTALLGGAIYGLVNAGNGKQIECNVYGECLDPRDTRLGAKLALPLSLILRR